MGIGGPGAIQEGKLVDWSRQGLDCSVALDQVHMIVKTSSNAITAIRNMIQYLDEEVVSLLQRSEEKQILSGVANVDALLEQIAAIVAEASLGEVNLLGHNSGCMNIPYLLTEIEDAGGYHNLVTMGTSITPVREDLPGMGEHLVGIYSLSTDENHSVCWLSAPGFWVKMQKLESDGELNRSEFRGMLGELRLRVKQLDQTLSVLSLQLDQYVEKVGEVITDPLLESC